MTVKVNDFQFAKFLASEEGRTWSPTGLFKARPPEMFNTQLGYNK
jgi:hypothetical protein